MRESPGDNLPMAASAFPRGRHKERDRLPSRTKRSGSRKHRGASWSPSAAAPALRGGPRGSPPEDMPSGPQEGISSKSQFWHETLNFKLQNSFPAKSNGKGWGREDHCLCLVPSGWLPPRSVTCVTVEWSEDEATHRARRGPGRILLAGPFGCFWVPGGSGCWEAAEGAAGSGVSALVTTAQPFWALNIWGLTLSRMGTESQLAAEGQGSADRSPALTPGGWDAPPVGSEEGLAHPEPGEGAVGPGLSPRRHPSPVHRRSPWKVLPVLLTAPIDKSSAGWVVPPWRTNRLTLSTPLVLEGPSMQ